MAKFNIGRGTGPINPIEFHDGYGNMKNGKIRPIKFEEPSKNPEEKVYLILYYYSDNSGNLDKSFELCHGRTECINFIIENIEDIDILQSKILTETRQTETSTGDIKNYFLYIDSALSVYDFFKYMESIGVKLEIDIEDYNYATPEDATDAHPYQQLPNTEAMNVWKAVMDESHEDTQPAEGTSEEDRYV